MEKNKFLIRSVIRALKLIKCFSFNKRELTLQELSKITNIPKTTVFRILISLENQGFIEKNKTTQTYKLGIML